MCKTTAAWITHDTEKKSLDLIVICEDLRLQRAVLMSSKWACKAFILNGHCNKEQALRSVMFSDSEKKWCDVCVKLCQRGAGQQEEKVKLLDVVCICSEHITCYYLNNIFVFVYHESCSAMNPQIIGISRHGCDLLGQYPEMWAVLI